MIPVLATKAGSVASWVGATAFLEEEGEGGGGGRETPSSWVSAHLLSG